MTLYRGNKRIHVNQLLFVIAVVTVLVGGCGRLPRDLKPGQQGVSERTPRSASQNSINVVGSKILPNGAGWVWGSKADELIMLRTTDGAKQWQQVTLPVPPKLKEGTSPGGVAAFFTDIDHGWLAFASQNANLTVYRTENAGKSWLKSTADVKGLSAQIQFIDNKNGWMLIHQGAATMHEEVSFIRTTDGGSTWKVTSKVPKNSTSPPPGSIPYAGDKNGFTFKDANNGFLTAFSPEPGRPFLYTTTDAGRTWQSRPLVVAKEYSNAELAAMPPSFFGANEGVLPVVINTQGQTITLYTTQDGGQTWKPGTPTKSAQVQPWVWSFSDAKHGFVTDGQHFYTTADAGKTWTSRKLDTQLAKSSQIVQLDFTDEQQGWAVVAEEIASGPISNGTASNGAVSQGAANQSAASQGVAIRGAVSQGPANQGAAIRGAGVNQAAANQDATAIPEINGALFQTQDGGKTWHRVSFDAITPIAAQK